MSNRTAVYLFATVVLAAVLSACDHPSATAIYVATPPPPPLADTVVVAPSPQYVWVRGYYAWNGGRYVWVPGHWELRPPGRRRWIPGHWAQTPRGWYWVPGHWR